MAAAVFFHALPRLKPWIVAGLQLLFCRAISCYLFALLSVEVQKKVVFIYHNYCRKVAGVHNFIILYWVKLGKK